MSVSKLFTPKLMPQATADKCFVSPLHTPEMEEFYGPADSGEPYFPLRLGGGRQTRTPSPEKRKSGISTKPQEKFRY